MLGAAAAHLLGIDRIWPGEGSGSRRPQWFYVAGILEPASRYAPEIDSAVLVGFPAAEHVPRLRRPPLDDLRPYRRDRPASPRGGQPARRPGQPGKPQPGRRLPALGRAHRPGRRQGRARTPCSSASARSRCWSARSASPTSWSSRCWNAAPRSGCAAPWAPPAARSAPSSSPKHPAVPGRRGHRRHPGAAATAVYARGHGDATRHPARGLGWRPGRGRPDRRPRRVSARPPRRPAVSHPGAVGRAPTSCERSDHRRRMRDSKPEGVAPTRFPSLHPDRSGWSATLARASLGGRRPDAGE